jgi:hypothetical protein
MDKKHLAIIGAGYWAKTSSATSTSLVYSNHLRWRSTIREEMTKTYPDVALPTTSSRT